MREALDYPLAPVDTVTVWGGKAVTTVESEAVRLAASRMANAAHNLRLAALQCAEVSRTLVFPGVSPFSQVWGGIPSGEQYRHVGAWDAGDAGLAASARALDTAVRDAAQSLGGRADLCDLLSWRLLRAAGLYEDAESTAEHVIGTAVTVGCFGVGAGFASLGWYGLVGLGLMGAAEVAARRVGSVLTGGLSSVLTQRAGAIATRSFATYSDEAFTGLGAGVALTRSGLAQGHGGVVGGAGVLAHVIREIPLIGNDDQGVRVTRLRPEDFAEGALPTWSSSGAGSIQEALTRVDALYPGKGGAPEATIAVQKVTGFDGAVSWTVLIPGTESAFAADHPWDGRTDLELVAGQADAATAAIEHALEDSGVRAGEPVTFVGHSLGGIAAMVLASRAGFTERYQVRGVVTAGAPTGTLTTPPGIAVLHLQTPEEVVSHSGGHSAAENPRTRDRVTVVRSLSDSADAVDHAASGSVVQAHSIPTHVRTLDLAIQSGDPRVSGMADRIDSRLDGKTVTTMYYSAERVSQ